ncbi:CASP-like protein 4D1 [Prosopis cineraria]|uniref:CASP-like protein 4D1 n=1 Tax=Prosopis cineraria TaxID=364024 RepID=UPI002410ACAE|nr:CASP-like protein 4D1 [Prosopis cineraria]
MESSASRQPSSSSLTISGIGLLVLRVMSMVVLVVALILISIDKGSEVSDDGERYKIKFNDLHSYRYMMVTIIIGFAYNFFQMALSIFHVVSGKRLISGDFGYLLDFSGDEIISYLLATGAAAGFGATLDVHSTFTEFLNVHFDSFFNKANASASLLLAGFLFTATSSILASYALPKKV